MAEILLFHHVQGLTPGVLALADRFRDAGHTVHTPDMMAGNLFETIDEGIKFVLQEGFGAYFKGSLEIAKAYPTDVVYMGISIGAKVAQFLAQNRAGAKAAVLLEGAIDPAKFGAWRDEVPLQIHGADHDPRFADTGELDVAKALVDSIPNGELFLYPGDQHLFTDSSEPAYDEAATDLVLERVLKFLAEL